MTNSCSRSGDEDGGETKIILAADREAPVGWVRFSAFEDHTFKYSLSRGDNHYGTFKLCGDTLFLSSSDTTIGIHTVILRERSIEFLGQKTPRFASITIDKIRSK